MAVVREIATNSDPFSLLVCDAASDVWCWITIATQTSTIVALAWGLAPQGEVAAVGRSGSGWVPGPTRGGELGRIGA